MKIEFGKVHFFVFTSVLVLLLGGYFVYAYGTNNPQVFGHSLGEIDGFPDCNSNQALTKTISGGWGCVNLPTSGLPANVEIAQAFVELDRKGYVSNTAEWVDPKDGSSASAQASADAILSPVQVISGNSDAFVRLINVGAFSTSRWSTGPLGGSGAYANNNAPIGKFDGIGCAPGWQKMYCGGNGPSAYQSSGAWMSFSAIQIVPHSTGCITSDFDLVAESYITSGLTDIGVSPLTMSIICMKLS